jgi:hypothetical protein
MKTYLTSEMIRNIHNFLMVMGDLHKPPRCFLILATTENNEETLIMKDGSLFSLNGLINTAKTELLREFKKDGH